MAQVTLSMDRGPAPSMLEFTECSERRLAGLVEDHYDFIWRALRRLGVPTGDADDGAQQVFLTASRKLAAIRPGAERSFLVQTALRVASTHRRACRRRREADPGEESESIDFVDPSPAADELVELRNARIQLDRILDAMPLDLRAVFVLFELEQTTMAEIGAILELPPGTVASRLRRAREAFYRSVDELERTPRPQGRNP